jgi:hypothetical protein
MEYKVPAECTREGEVSACFHHLICDECGDTSPGHALPRIPKQRSFEIFNRTRVKFGLPAFRVPEDLLPLAQRTYLELIDAKLGDG